MIYDIICEKCGHKDEWICSVSQYEKRKNDNECSKCGTKNSMKQNYYTNESFVIFKGSGWTRSFVGGKGESKASRAQRDLDKELKRNDQLRENVAKNIGPWGRKTDAIKRAEDQRAKEQGW
jgi:predicted nucleic acid-binding Zn ribbon protein